MRWFVIRTIWFREVRDQLRDRRTLFMLVGLPLLLYPLLSIAVVYFSSEFAGQTLTIGIAGYELVERDGALPPLLDPKPPEAKSYRFANALFLDPREREQFRVVLGTAIDLEGQLKRGEVQAYLLFTEPFLADLRAGKQVELDVRLRNGELLPPAKVSGGGRPALPRLSSDDERGELAYKQLRPVLREWDREIVRSRMLTLNKPADFGQPLILPLPEPKTEKIWAMIFPFLIVMMALTGALYPAIDVCAGEKERGTMETLLISPASRSEIVAGKFLTVWMFSAAMALLNLASMAGTALVFSHMFNTSAALVGSTDGLSAPDTVAILWCVVLLVPLAAFLSAVCLALAVYARSTKEGQYYLMPLMVCTMLLTIFSVLPGVKLTPFLSMLPVTGASLLLKELIAPQSQDQSVWLYLVPVLLPLGAYGYLALHWAVVQFNREEVLFREAERLDLGLWLQRVFREKEPLPTPAMAVACFITLLIVRWVLSSYGAQLPLLALNAVLQIGGVIAPAVLMATLLTSSPGQTLRLRWPSFEAGSRGLLLPAELSHHRGVSAIVWVLAGGVLALALHGPLVILLALTLRRFPGLEDQLEGFKQLAETLLGPDTPLVSQLLVLAVLPAVAEETMFRGFILSGLRTRLGPGKAIVVSSVLFAFAHMSAFRFVPTLVLGLILALLALRSGSLLPGVIFHSIHNGMLILAHAATQPQNRGAWWTAMFDPAGKDPLHAGGLYDWNAAIAGALVATVLLMGLCWRRAAPSAGESGN
jgi:sodium transport system permease protein